MSYEHNEMKLIKFLKEQNISLEQAMSIIKAQTPKECNKNLTEMGRYIAASNFTPTEAGMSPGRCPI